MRKWKALLLGLLFYFPSIFAQDSLIVPQDSLAIDSLTIDSLAQVYILEQLDSSNFMSTNSGAKVVDCSIKGWKRSNIFGIIQDTLQRNARCRIPNKGQEFWFIIELPIKIHLNAFAFNTGTLKEDATLRYVTIETSGLNQYQGYTEAVKELIQKTDDYQVVTVGAYDVKWIKFTVNNNWGNPRYTEIGRIYAYNDTSVDKYEEELMENKKVDVFNIYFDNDADEVQAPSMPAINAISGILKKHPEWKIKIEGHTDNIGDVKYNVKLSKRRAEAVKQILLETGVENSIIVEGFGQKKPFCEENSDDCHSKNRRVTFKILN